MFKGLDGYYKINNSYGGGMKKVHFYNPITKDEKNIVVDDTEYEYGRSMGLIDRNYTLQDLEAMDRMPVNEEVRKIFLIDNNVPFVGATIEVVKGRKYNKGDKGVITRLYDYKDRFGRFIAIYAITDNGMKINTNNTKVLS